MTGAVCATYAAARGIASDDVAFVETIGHLAGQALERARLLESERTAADRLGRLQTVTALLAGAMTVEEVARIMVHEGVDRGAAGALVLAAEDGMLETIEAIGFSDELLDLYRRFGPDDPVVAAQVYSSGQPRWVESSRRDDGDVPAAGTRPRSPPAGRGVRPALLRPRRRTGRAPGELRGPAAADRGRRVAIPDARPAVRPGDRGRVDNFDGSRGSRRSCSAACFPRSPPARGGLERGALPAGKRRGGRRRRLVRPRRRRRRTRGRRSRRCRRQGRPRRLADGPAPHGAPCAHPRGPLARRGPRTARRTGEDRRRRPLRDRRRLRHRPRVGDAATRRPAIHRPPWCGAMGRSSSSTRQGRSPSASRRPRSTSKVRYGSARTRRCSSTPTA